MMNRTRWMVWFLACACAVGATGCSSFQSRKPLVGPPANAAPAGTSAKSSQPVTVTPAAGVIGRVASVNAAGQFVVITFQPGSVPAAGQKLNVYRDSLKVGEVRLSSQQMGWNRVADIVAGEAKPGDEARTD